MTTRRKELGRWGEECVDALFESWGWERVAANVRTKGGEIDRVYGHGRDFCVAEVKTLLVPPGSGIDRFLGGDFLAGALRPRQCRNLARMGAFLSRGGARAHVRVFRVFRVEPVASRDEAARYLLCAFGEAGPVKVVDLGPRAVGLSIRPEFVPRRCSTSPLQIEIG